MRLLRVSRRFLLPVLLVGGLALVGALLLRGAANGPPGGRLVEVAVGEVRRTSPLALLTTEAEGDVVTLVYASLMRPGPDGTPEVDLAESWEVTPDGLTYTFRLRPGLTWHDGKPLTASDVAFTIERIQAGDFAGPPSLAAAWVGVAVFVSDPRTVLFHLVEPSAEFLSRASIGVVPRHHADSMAGDGLDIPAFERQPVGAGPYRVRAIEDDRVHLERFEGYAHGAPHIGRIELRLARDASEQARLLADGDADTALLGEAPLEDEAALSRRRDLRSTSLTRSAHTLIYLNLHLPPFDDLATRRALAAAIDRTPIVTAAGRGLSGFAPFVPGTWAASDAQAPSGNAAEMLEAAGWHLEGDGLRRKGGQPLTIEVATNDDPTRRAVAEAVVSQWRSHGADVKVAVLSANALVRERLQRAAYQAAIYGWDAGIDPDPYPGWHTTQVGGAGANVAGFQDREADALLEAARTNLDTRERRELYGLFTARFTGQVASVVLYYPQRPYVVPAGLRGFTPGVLFTPGSRFRDVHLWQLP
jgi:peptide/nickel transport system substrate-binding protein